MQPAAEVLDRQLLTMRERVLSLAADLDRIERAPGGQLALADPRLGELLECLRICLLPRGGDRARRVQDLLSDHTPPPPYRAAR